MASNTGYFNSRAHVERDPASCKMPLICLAISTHALTWSATTYHWYDSNADHNFNSRAHVERDVQQSNTNLMLNGDFNSRAHVERDAVNLAQFFR